MNFPGKRALWWYLVLLAVFLGTGLSVWEVIKEPGVVTSASAAVMFCISFFALSIQVRNDLTLEETFLLIRFGPLTRRIPYTDIRSISRTRNPISSLATSVDRVSIELYDGRYYCVSARDNDRFAIELKSRWTEELQGD